MSWCAVQIRDSKEGKKPPNACTGSMAACSRERVKQKNEEHLNRR
jgi:hypothetical protein